MDFVRPLLETQPAAAPKKRKSDAGNDEDDDYTPTAAAKPAAPKKARVSKGKGKGSAADPHAEAKALVKAIVANPEAFIVPADEVAVRAQLLAVARYAAALEVGEAEGAEGTKIVKAPSAAEVAAAADRLRGTVASQIRKQMVWEPSCKQGSAKWAYEGIASDPAIFQHFMNLDAPANFKAKKITIPQLHDILDAYALETSIRFGSLRLTGGDVNIKWNKESGEFRIGGTYGL